MNLKIWKHELWTFDIETSDSVSWHWWSKFYHSIHIFVNLPGIYHINSPNVGKYTIHGWYGYIWVLNTKCKASFFLRLVGNLHTPATSLANVMHCFGDHVVQNKTDSKQHKQKQEEEEEQQQQQPTTNNNQQPTINNHRGSTSGTPTWRHGSSNSSGTIPDGEVVSRSNSVTVESLGTARAAWGRRGVGGQRICGRKTLNNTSR